MKDDCIDPEKTHKLAQGIVLSIIFPCRYQNHPELDGLLASAGRSEY